MQWGSTGGSRCDKVPHSIRYVCQSFGGQEGWLLWEEARGFLEHNTNVSGSAADLPLAKANSNSKAGCASVKNIVKGKNAEEQW